MSKKEIVINGAIEVAKYIQGNAGWDYDNSKIEGLMCQDLVIIFYLYMKKKYNIIIDIAKGEFLNGYESTHYWNEYDGKIIDFTCFQFINEIEEFNLEKYIKEGNYIFNKDIMNKSGIYIGNKVDINSFKNQYSNEFNYYLGKIDNIDNILDDLIL